MVCVTLFIYWIVLDFAKTQTVFRETEPCGKNITNAWGELIISNHRLSPCKWRFIIPNGEKIYMSFTKNQSNSFEMSVYNEIENRSTVFNESHTNRNGDVVIPTNSSNVVVSIRLFVLTEEPGLVIRYYSDETEPCGKNITNAWGELIISNHSLDPCTWRFIIPNGEKIYMRFTKNQSNSFEMSVYNEIEDRSTVFNESHTNRNMDVVIPTNTSNVVVSIRLFVLKEAPGLVIRYYSDEIKPCGKNITNAEGKLIIPNHSLDPCTWWFIRPNGENIYMSFTKDQSNSFEIAVFNDIEDRSIFNESYSSGNGDVVISTNTSKSLVSIRMLFLTEAPGLVIRYYSDVILPCLGYTDTNGVVWKSTLPNNYDYQTCGKGMTGKTSNFCKLKEGRYGVWKGPDNSLCVSEALSSIAAKLHLTLNGTSNVTLANVLRETLDVTNKLISKDNFNAGNLKSVIDSLDLVLTIIEERSSLGTTKRERENFVSVLDKLLSVVNEKSWRTLKNKINTTNHVSTIMNVVSRFGFTLNVNQSEDVTLIRENIVIEAKKAFIDDLIFPTVTALPSIYQQMTNTRLFLSKDTIRNNLNGSIDYTGVYYRTLTKLLPSTFGLNIGSDVVSFSLPAFTGENNLDPPVQIGYEHVYSNKTNSTCVFWDFDKGIDGGWSTYGCYAEYRNTSYTSCRCNHFTNFAVLMSVHAFSEEDTTALTIITWPGLVTSILCLLVTIFLHIYFWRNVNSDKSKILICLCSVLVLAYIILLAGLNLTEDSSMCSAIAVVLHYLFLCALCLMVAEGIDIAMSILIVFSQGGSNAGLLLSFGLVFPLVIVVISMAVTRFIGYGTDKYCWLSVSNGLIYAFLVPCIVAVLTNIIISILVLRKMFSTKVMMNKDTKEKIRAGVRSIAVLAPILGLTWLFGILASLKDLIVFAYLFTILNSCQGLFIFIFHCLMNPKIQQAVKRKYDRFVQDHPWARMKRKEKTDVSTVDTVVSKTAKPTTGTESTSI